MRTRTAIAWLGAGWLAVVGLGLATRSLVPVDETRYVAVAWHMWHRSDFLLPWLAGEPYSHKPPLLFWLMHAGWAVFGVNEWWPRLISPLLSLAAVALTARLARRLWPDDAGIGWRAGALLAGSALWVVYASATMFDVLLTCCALVGALGLHAMAQPGQGRRGALLLVAGLAGGLLAKGPMVLLQLLPLALLARTWAPAGWRAGRWAARVATAVAAAALLALAWAVPAALRGGEAYRDAIFWGQTAGRVVEAFDHARPWWWYLPLLPLLAFPWSVWPPVWRGLRALAAPGPARGEPGLRFVLAWALPVFVALCAVSGKQVHYLLPLFPAGALLGARALRGAGPARRFDTLPVLTLGAAVGAALLALGVWHPADRLAPWLAGLSPGWAALPLAWALVLGWHQRHAGTAPAGRLPALALAGALLPAMLQAIVFHVAGPAYDARPLGQALARLQAQAAPLALVHAEDHASFDFAARLRQPMAPVPAAALAAWFEAHPRGVALLYVRPRDWDPARAAVFAQPFRGQYAVLVDARQWRAWLQPPGGGGG